MEALCVPSTFTAPDVHGAANFSFATSFHRDFAPVVLSPYSGQNEAFDPITFCNVTVTYTHPGQNDHLLVEIWLPEKWNNRSQGVGGGGFVAGFTSANSIYNLVATVADGYVATTRDAGLGPSTSPKDWGLLSDGNVNLFALQNLASVSLHDEAIIGKSVMRQFYGCDVAYSYYNGCSQSGRQGLKLAQSYPDMYDGILSIAPAINFHSFFMQMFWPQMIMKSEGKYPHPEELDALTAAAIEECDPLDGVLDGIIFHPKDCHFDPFAHVGKPAGNNITISEVAAKVAHGAWTGPRTVDGEFIWHGVEIGADLTGKIMTKMIVSAATECSSNGTCIGLPFFLPTDWMTFFLAKNSTFDYTSMTHEEFDDLYFYGLQQWHSIIDTSDPDLSRFKATGGKILSWHGTNDQLIPLNGTLEYYNKVKEVVPNTYDFYRVFEAPGVQHCFGGDGGIPDGAFDALRDWVEKGVAPETLAVTHKGPDGTIFNQILCPYPSRTVIKGGEDPTSADAYACV